MLYPSFFNIILVGGLLLFFVFGERGEGTERMKRTKQMFSFIARFFPFYIQGRGCRVYRCFRGPTGLEGLSPAGGTGETIFCSCLLFWLLVSFVFGLVSCGVLGQHWSWLYDTILQLVGFFNSLLLIDWLVDWYGVIRLAHPITRSINGLRVKQVSNNE